MYTLINRVVYMGKRRDITAEEIWMKLEKEEKKKCVRKGRKGKTVVKMKVQYKGYF
jgi:hypothetical protein